MKRHRESLMKRPARSAAALMSLLLVVGAYAQPAADTPVQTHQTADVEVTAAWQGPAVPDAPVQPAVPDAPPLPPDPPEPNPVVDRVRIGTRLTVDLGETVRDAVAIFSSSRVDGAVEGDMVTVFGDAAMNGTVRRDMVTVFGSAEVNGPVGGDLVTVFGSLKLGPEARVGLEGHDCVVVFGSLEEDPAAVVETEVVEVFPALEGVSSYLRQGPLMGRLIPPTSAFAWIVVALHLVVYLLVALLAPKPIASCVRRINSPGPFLLSFGVGILVMLMLAPLIFILVATGVGIFLVPFVHLAETAALVFGKTAVIEFFGLHLLRQPVDDSHPRPFAPFLAGFALITVLYMIPVVGLIVWTLLRPLSLGAPVMMLLGNGRKTGDGGPPASPPIPVRISAPAYGAAAGARPPLSGHDPTSGEGFEPSAMAASPEPGVAMMARAGFWVRTAATAVDVVLLVLLSKLANWPPSTVLLVFLVYHLVFWAWKGATVGGLVCRIRLVRIDGRPADFAVSLVRGLMSLLSGLALGLGFFWAGWTRERQSWHDKAAGTVMVHVPKGLAPV